jgi:hypothetical protein
MRISDIEGLLWGSEMEDYTFGKSWRRRNGAGPKKHGAAMPAEWAQVRKEILCALAGFPEARAAVAAAMRKFVSEDEL